MCLLVFAWRSHPRYRLVFAGNRDEFHERPAQAAHWWQDRPGLLAGRDLRGGGTWLAVTRAGRFAVVTNYREIDPPDDSRPSRGTLVPEMLSCDSQAAPLLSRLRAEGARFAGFNLIWGDGQTVHYFSNRGAHRSPLAAGIHGLSNHELDSPWPKLERVREAFQDALQVSEPDIETMFAILGDRRQADSHRLPRTHLPAAQEKLLSAPFIVSPRYGTRCSTILLQHRGGQITFVERSFDPGGEPTGTVRFDFLARASSTRMSEQ